VILINFLLSVIWGQLFEAGTERRGIFVLIGAESALTLHWDVEQSALGVCARGKV
jgi:hypothetical protein